MPHPQEPTQPRGMEDLLVAGEHIVLTVKRHFIGLVFIYLQALLGVAAVFALLYFVNGELFSGTTDSSRIILGIVFVSIVMLFIFLFVATYVYRQNRLLVTNKNLIQINQKSLFIRQVARPSMSNVEDVSADTRGILATIFNYGTLLVQTAGERPNFEFKYTPNPNHYADIVLEARQAYAESVEE